MTLSPEDAAFFLELRRRYPDGLPADLWNRVFLPPPQPGLEEAVRRVREAFRDLPLEE